MMDAKTERSNRKKANAELADMGRTYWDGLPLAQFDEVLTKYGFSALESAIYCGRDGRSNEQVGERTWFNFTWHKMEATGRYEVVAYLS